MTAQSITLPIEDFGCAGSGALIVEQALRKIPGVIRTYMNTATEMVYIRYDAERCTLEALEVAIVRAGFHPGAPIIANAPFFQGDRQSSATIGDQVADGPRSTDWHGD